MSDKPQIKLSEAVVLIDAAFLNFVITDMKATSRKLCNALCKTSTFLL